MAFPPNPALILSQELEFIIVIKNGIAARGHCLFRDGGLEVVVSRTPGR